MMKIVAVPVDDLEGVSGNWDRVFAASASKLDVDFGCQGIVVGECDDLG